MCSKKKKNVFFIFFILFTYSFSDFLEYYWYRFFFFSVLFILVAFIGAAWVNSPISHLVDKVSLNLQDLVHFPYLQKYGLSKCVKGEKRLLGSFWAF